MLKLHDFITFLEHENDSGRHLSAKTILGPTFLVAEVGVNCAIVEKVKTINEKEKEREPSIPQIVSSLLDVYNRNSN